MNIFLHVLRPSKRVMYFLENLPEKSARIYKAIILGYCKVRKCQITSFKINTIFIKGRPGTPIHPPRLPQPLFISVLACYYGLCKDFTVIYRIWYISK